MESPVPVQVTGLTSGVVQVAVGNSTVCAVTASGGVQCWGSNYGGKLGNGSTSDSSLPVAVVGLPGPVTAVSIGFSHVCAQTASGGVVCWGDDNQGQLGDQRASNSVCGGSYCSLTPVQVHGLTSGVTALIGEGGLSTCALEGGHLLCWGAVIGGYQDATVPMAGPL